MPSKEQEPWHPHGAKLGKVIETFRAVVAADKDAKVRASGAR